VVTADAHFARGPGRPPTAVDVVVRTYARIAATSKHDLEQQAVCAGASREARGGRVPVRDYCVGDYCVGDYFVGDCGASGSFAVSGASPFLPLSDAGVFAALLDSPPPPVFTTNNGKRPASFPSTSMT
jgi:hypothetical protein